MEQGVHPCHELFKQLGLDHDAEWSEVADALNAAPVASSPHAPAFFPDIRIHSDDGPSTFWRSLI